MRIRLVTTVMAGATVAALAVPALAVQDVQPARVSGATRLETAAAVAGLSFPAGADEAVLATSVTFSDALVGAALAGALDGPVLLNPPDELAEPTAQALADLGVQRVTLLGSEFSLSTEVADSLAETYTVERIGGDTLYETAGNVAQAAAAAAGGLPEVDGRSTVLLASGEDFPDALAASGPSHDAAFPLLLTRQTTLPPETAAALEALEPEQVILFGGSAAISTEIEDGLGERGIATTRLGGATRTDTAAIAADYFLDQGLFDGLGVLLARGDEFPDALTAGALSARRDAPILLTANDEVLSRETVAWLVDHCPTIETLQIVGGTEAVPVALANEAEAAAESCASGPVEGTRQTFEVDPQQPREEPAGEAIDFTVARRTDGEPLAGTLDLVLFPCEGADVLGSADDTFADADADGGADGFASSDTGSARIVAVNGEAVDPAAILSAAPDGDGDIDVRLNAQAADCTVLAVIDGNGNGKFDVDEAGRPTEPYGVAKASWTAS